MIQLIKGGKTSQRAFSCCGGDSTVGNFLCDFAELISSPRSLISAAQSTMSVTLAI